MTETIALFGRASRLVGVLTHPPAGSDDRASGLPAVVVLNAGLLHRVGPNRTTVALARRLATSGHVVLRFDFSGIGDSEPRRDDQPLERSTLDEARAAMGYLTATTGADRFVLIGLCEGAENAFQIAHEDPRVVGAVLMDGYAYPTLGFRLRNLGRQAGRRLHRAWEYVTGRRDWRARLDSALARLAGGAERGPREALDLGRAFPAKHIVSGQLRALVARDVRLLFVYTGIGMREHYNYPGQLVDAFPFLRRYGHARVVFMPGTDHTFTLRRHQEALMRTLDEWMWSSLRRDGFSAASRTAKGVR